MACKDIVAYLDHRKILEQVPDTLPQKETLEAMTPALEARLDPEDHAFIEAFDRLYPDQQKPFELLLRRLAAREE